MAVLMIDLNCGSTAHNWFIYIMLKIGHTTFRFITTLLISRLQT